MAVRFLYLANSYLKGYGLLKEMEATSRTLTATPFVEESSLEL